MLKKEWKNLFKNKFLIVALIAIMTIPTIYTTLFLNSMWDPYGKVENLPVAIVNNDIPVTYEDTDKRVNVGEKLVDKLKDDDSLAFNFVDEKTALEGLENGTYYMVITVPENFSANAITLLDENPEKMVLEYATNPGKNYIASKMSDSALTKIQNSVSNTVSENYAETVFEQFDEIGESLTEAADGSLELKDGLVKLEDGGNKLTDGLSTLSDSMGTFTTGAGTLSEGLNTYLTGVETVDGASEALYDGSNQLAVGAGTLSQGLNSYLDGASTVDAASKELAAGVDKLAAGANELNSKVQGISLPTIELSKEQKETLQNTAASGTVEYANQLSAGIGSAVSGNIVSTLTSDKTVGAVSQQILADSNIAQMVAALQSVGYSKEQAEALVVGIISNTLKGVSGNITADSITNAISPTVSSTIGQIAGGAAEKGALAVVDQVNSNLGSYGEMFTALKDGTKTLSDGLNTLNAGTSQLKDGTSQLVANNSALKDGMNSLSGGLNTLNAGTSQLKDGTSQLVANNSALKDGMNSLSDGANQISSGVTQLYDGSITLSDGLKTAGEGTETLEEGLSEGADKLKDKLKFVTASTSEMFGSPVDSEKTELTELPNNGHAMASYMMVVALWVACMGFCSVYPITKQKGQIKSGFRLWFSKATIMFPTIVLAAGGMLAALMHFNNFEPANLSGTMLVAAVAGITFMSMLYFLNSAFGVVGRFIGFVLMVVQLSGCTGTYPVELSGEFVEKITNYLPFTHVVKAFRETIVGGSNINSHLIFLGCVALVCTILTIAFFELKVRMGHAQDFMEDDFEDQAA